MRSRPRTTTGASTAPSRCGRRSRARTTYPPSPSPASSAPRRCYGRIGRPGSRRCTVPPTTTASASRSATGEVSLLELARAYAGLARGGTLPAVRSVAWQRSGAGDTLRTADAPASPNGLAPAVTYLLTDILSDPEARAPGFGRGGPLELPFPAAVKTGTSKDYRDNWAVGTTPTHTVAVWAGNFDGSPMRWVSGVSGAGPILHTLLRTLGSGGDFARPAGIVEAVVCPQSGLRPGAYCPSRSREVFLAGTVPTDTCAVHRRVALDRRIGPPRRRRHARRRRRRPALHRLRPRVSRLDARARPPLPAERQPCRGRSGRWRARLLRPAPRAVPRLRHRLPPRPRPPGGLPARHAPRRRRRRRARPRLVDRRRTVVRRSRRGFVGARAGPPPNRTARHRARWSTPPQPAGRRQSFAAKAIL